MARKIILAIIVLMLVPTAFVGVVLVWPWDPVALPKCPLPSGVSAFRRLDDAPPELVRALTQRVGEIVPVGARFDATDVVFIGPGKFRRLIFIWSRNNRWVVATERGGIAYNDPIFAFEIEGDRREAVFLREEIALPGSICSTASGLLDVAGSPAS
ncbi:hypothetical protein [Bradyrhizobium sp. STM 3809]|uniref:hypothetical protein n=1 Tax=Bradyrhizobium sp. STM 3809 TaxID=551936 RepID=UPI0002409272|nr:hypothetical protein [Bradyrhizobium sp. STM 3809]CCE00680.1 exported hypothetical protein [Bradyrhizobium sp. STM 3809]